MRNSRIVLAALMCGAPIPAFAQEAPPPAETPSAETGPQVVEPSAEVDPAQPVVAGEDPYDPDAMMDEEAEDIVVTGTRLRGSVVGNIPPEITLSPRDIRAYGASNIAELLDALAPQTGSGRGRGGGRPVVLLNGRRISSFSEIRDLPTEAISRTEILPEEVALRYGYRADQRVVNIVLRQRFDAVTAELGAGTSTEGGRGTAEGEVNYLNIAGPTRTSFGIQYQNQSALLESERDIIQSVSPVGLDAGDFRTLLPESDTLTLSATHSRQLSPSIAGTIDARYIQTSNLSLLGLPGNDPAAGIALNRTSDVSNAHLGLSLNGDIAPWRWTLTANYDRVETDTNTQRLLGIAADTANNVNQSLTTTLVANGPVVGLWAGDLTASLKVEGELRSFDSESFRSGNYIETSLSRERLEGQASFDLPITSRRREVLDAIGDLSVNLNLNVEELSDFGTLTTVGYGLNWRPIPEVSFIASVTEEDGAPSVNQLGDPVLSTPNVRIFDFVRGETVDITRIEGGNPALLSDNRRVINLGLNVRPLEGLSFRANYTDSSIDNPIASFPAATAEIEAAFPERFVRDGDGRLVSIDSRPINFTRSDRREIRWGFDLSRPLGQQRPSEEQMRQFRERRAAMGQGGEGGPRGPGGPGAGDGPRGDGPGAGRGGRGRGGFGGGPGGGRFGGRWQLGVFHTWRLEDTVLIRPGLPELDFLDGSAAGNSGATPRHQVEVRAGLFYQGFGARMNIDWQEGTRVRGGPDGDLFFSDLTRVNLRLFANLGQQRDLVRSVPFLRNSRISLDIDNLFDARVDVRDATGTTPLGYQPGYLDPLGRSVRVTFRKQFF